MSTTGVSSARPLSPLGWLGLPALICIAATVVLATPIRIFGLALPEPVFPLALAFAWALIRPSVLPPFALLALGLFLDVFWGGPQGLWPLCLLAAYAAVLLVRRLVTGQDFVVMAAWYALASAVAFGVGYGLISLDSGSPPSLTALGWQYIWTVALFPFAWRLIE